MSWFIGRPKALVPEVVPPNKLMSDSPLVLFRGFGVSAVYSANHKTYVRYGDFYDSPGEFHPVTVSGAPANIDGHMWLMGVNRVGSRTIGFFHAEHDFDYSQNRTTMEIHWAEMVSPDVFMYGGFISGQGANPHPNNAWGVGNFSSWVEDDKVYLITSVRNDEPTNYVKTGLLVSPVASFPDFKFIHNQVPESPTAHVEGDTKFGTTLLRVGSERYTAAIRTKVGIAQWKVSADLAVHERLTHWIMAPPEGGDDHVGYPSLWAVDGSKYMQPGGFGYIFYQYRQTLPVRGYTVGHSLLHIPDSAENVYILLSEYKKGKDTLTTTKLPPDGYEWVRDIAIISSSPLCTAPMVTAFAKSFNEHLPHITSWPGYPGHITKTEGYLWDSPSGIHTVELRRVFNATDKNHYVVTGGIQGVRLGYAIPVGYFG